MRLNAYYFGFDATGVTEIDNVLSAVACAGKAYHHTEHWNEGLGGTYEPTHRGDDPVAWIQNAATDAAALVDKLRAVAEAARRVVGPSPVTAMSFAPSVTDMRALQEALDALAKERP